jgi:hypothetical protein
MNCIGGAGFRVRMRIVQGNRLMVAASTNQIDSFQDVHGGMVGGPQHTPTASSCPMKRRLSDRKEPDPRRDGIPHYSELSRGQLLTYPYRGGQVRSTSRG